jgi:hypothetical protein
MHGQKEKPGGRSTRPEGWQSAVEDNDGLKRRRGGKRHEAEEIGAQKMSAGLFEQVFDAFQWLLSF